MKRVTKWFALAVIVLSGVACTALNEMSGKTHLDAPEPKPAKPYNRIALTTVTEPTFYDIKILAYNVTPSGVTLPGRIVAGGFNVANKFADEGRRNHRLTSTLQEWKFKLSDQLVSDTKRALEKAGYEVVLVNPEFRRGGRFATAYPKAAKPVDAYLDMYIAFAGYVAIKPGEPYVPTIETPVRLVDAFNGETLYAGVMNYGGPVPVDGPTDRPAEPENVVRGWDELCKVDCEVSPAVKGLAAGSKAIADLIAKNIK